MDVENEVIIFRDYPGFKEEKILAIYVNRIELNIDERTKDFSIDIVFTGSSKQIFTWCRCGSRPPLLLFNYVRQTKRIKPFVEKCNRYLSN